MKNITILIVLLLLVIVLIFFGSVTKENKNELANYYKITRPTLKKWIKHFKCGYTEQEWNRIRKLNGWQMSSIKYKLGMDAKMVLNKAEIADLASASHKVVAKTVSENLEKIGITQEAWDNCSIFPPAISEKIVKILTGTLTNEHSLSERLKIAVA